MAAPRLQARLGTGPVVLFSGLLAASAYPVLALTRSPLIAATALIAEAEAIVSGTVVSRALRQQLAPSNMQGRAGSAFITVIRGAQPLGALAGGLLASVAGLSGALLSAAGLQVAVLCVAGPLLLSRIRGAAQANRERRVITLVEGGKLDSISAFSAPSQAAG
jgi:predicted MFS family arabinose efflux permease